MKIVFFAVVVLLFPLSAQAKDETVGQIVNREAKLNGIDPNLVRAVIYAESAGDVMAVSHKNAQGLMQLIPATADRFGVTDVFDPAQNIKAGTRYLAWLYKRFDSWPLALAGYNAGEGKVDKYKGIPPYRETQKYVKKVLKKYAKLSGNNQAVDIPEVKLVDLDLYDAATTLGLNDAPINAHVKIDLDLYNKNLVASSGKDKDLYKAALVAPTGVNWIPPKGYYN